MTLFPYREFVIETRLSPDECAARFDATKPFRGWWWRTRHPHRGEVMAGGFVIRVCISATASGARVEGSMAPHVYWFALFSTVIGVGLLLSLVTIGSCVARGEWGNPVAVLPLGFTILVWAVLTCPGAIHTRVLLRWLRQAVATGEAVPLIR